MLAVRMQNPNWVKELERIFVFNNMNPVKVLVWDTTPTSFQFWKQFEADADTVHNKARVAFNRYFVSLHSPLLFSLSCSMRSFFSA